MSTPLVGITKTLLRAYVLACFADDVAKDDLSHSIRNARQEENASKETFLALEVIVRGQIIETLYFEGDRDQVTTTFCTEAKREVLENITYAKKYLKELSTAACDAGVLQD